MNRTSCKLSDLVEVKNGSTPSTIRSDFYDGNIIWITPKDLSNNKSKYIYSSERKITKAGFDSCSTSLLPIGSVLLSSRAPIGLLAICAVETCTNQGFKNLVVKKDKLHNEYLYYWLKTKVKYIDSLGTGTTFKEVSKGVIENLAIEIPKDLKDQQKIASVLSALDSKIELNNRINAELEAMAKTIYDYWFVQFDFPNKNGKPYKTSGGKMVWNEELKREIPKDWDSGVLSDLGEILGGSTPSRDIEENFDANGTPWITPKDLSENTENKFITKGEVSVSDKGLKSASLKILPKGSVLMSSRAPVGYMAIARVSVTTNQGFKSFVPKLDYSTSFIYYTIKNAMPEIINNASGSTFKEISGSTLKIIKVCLPNNIVIKEYTSKVDAIFDRQNNLEIENLKLTELRDWLLPMLMNGQVKVS